jgi:hypothetical protein
VARKDPTNPTLLATRKLRTARRRGQERSDEPNASLDEKALHSEKKGTKQPGTDHSPRVPKKARTKKHCNLGKKHGGAYTTHNTPNCRRFEKDGTEKSNFRVAKKDGKKHNPVKQSFAQLSE